MHFMKIYIRKLSTFLKLQSIDGISDLDLNLDMPPLSGNVTTHAPHGLLEQVWGDTMTGSAINKYVMTLQLSSIPVFSEAGKVTTLLKAYLKSLKRINPFVAPVAACTSVKITVLRACLKLQR